MERPSLDQIFSGNTSQATGQKSLQEIFGTTAKPLNPVKPSLPPPPKTGAIGGSIGGFVQNVNKDLTNSATDLAHSITETPQRAEDLTKATGNRVAGTGLALGESGLRAAGAVGGGLISFANDAVRAIPGVDALLNHIGQGFSEQTSQDPNSAGAKLVKFLNNFATEHPEITKDVAAAGNIVGAAAGVKGLQSAGKALPGAVRGVKDVVSSVSDAISGAKQSITGSSADASRQVWDVVKPTLSKTEQAQAVTEGKIVKSGILGTIKQIPQGRELQMIEAAKPYVAGISDPIKAVSNMKTGIASQAQDLRAGLAQSDAIWNQNTLKGALNGIDRPDMISADPTLNKAYDLVAKRVMKAASSAPKSLEGLLDVRQELDAQVAKQFPNLYNSDTMTPMRTAIKQIRGAINDMIEKQLPKGETPNGIPFKISLKNQSLLYDAIDNAASKAPKVGTNAITRTVSAIKKHPVATTAAALGTGYEIAKHGL